MLLQPFDVVVYIWLVIAVFSAGYVAVDQFRNNPEAPVMKWGFVLVTLYMGPIGLLLYVMADKEPAPGTHEQFVKPLWKQGVGSTVHCVAGDVIWPARVPGKWLLHCHIPHHTLNNNLEQQGAGGLTLLVDVRR